VPYDSSWGPHGIALAQQLRITLAPMALRVEHIGSTAIPGMTAKPVLDLQVSVEDLDRAAHAFERPLADHGFHRLPYEQDHVPAGYNDDPARQNGSGRVGNISRRTSTSMLGFVAPPTSDWRCYSAIGSALIPRRSPPTPGSSRS
jgi:GrpB-like predicted nucleotidyltransferase (UPF0157 family)